MILVLEHFLWRLYFIQLQSMAQYSTKLTYTALVVLMFLSGCYVSSFGPLIPFISEQTKQDETHYSYIFLLRSSANVIGGLFTKYLCKRFSPQYIIIISLLVTFVSLFLSTLSLNTINLAVSIFIASLGVINYSIIACTVVFKIYVGQHPQYYLQILGFVFGVGAMVGPFLVMLLQLNTLQVLGFFYLITLPVFFKYPLPDLGHNQRSSQSKRQISKTSQKFICLIMFIYATQQLGLASWIPTYSIKAGVADIDGAGIYSLFFWLSNCSFRLVWIFVPGSISIKLRRSLILLLISTTLTFMFQILGMYKLVCIFGPITSGILLSNMYTFCLALPADNGFDVTVQNNVHLVLANSFGEGLLIMPIGFCMNLFGFKSLIVLVCVFAFVAYWAFERAMLSMGIDKQFFETKKLLGQQLQEVK